MAKKLIVFCDGTWNTPDETGPNGKSCPTNVSKLFRSTCATDSSGNPQVVHYVQGVGTHPDDKIRGGVFGMGISKNIIDGYQFICSNYQPGDEIVLFGFSRGAYTARSLAGLIYNMGILKREYFDQIKNAYKRYRDHTDDWHPSRTKDNLATAFRAKYTHGDEKIHFLGVWDTVGALGAPYGLIIGFLINLIFKSRFHDIKLTPIIQNGYHALARHEKRWPFRPSLWKLHKDQNPKKFEEKWFDGVHSDVGGGYVNSGLSDSALEWMAAKAAKHGMMINLASLIPPVVPKAIPPHDSQKSYYRVPTCLMVKWPAMLFVDWPGKVFKNWPNCFYAALNRYNIIAEPDIGAKIARIDPRKGDYQRR